MAVRWSKVRFWLLSMNVHRVKGSGLIGPVMAHEKRPGTTSTPLAPSPSLHPSPRATEPSQEAHRGLKREVSAQSLSPSKEDDNDRLSPSVPANHYYMSCDPSPEDMEDTCSEYDNVGSDVEQDYDEVLHLNREGVMDMRYYKQYNPEDGGHTKPAVGDYRNESSSAVEQFAPKPRHNTETCEGSQSDTKPYKAGRPFRSHCKGSDKAESEVEKVLENSFFLNSGDEIEVLDGAKFIEDIEETENSVQRQVSHHQDSDAERIRKGRDDRERDDGARMTRNHNMPGVNKKCELSHVGAKEKQRQGKGRGRRATGKDGEHTVTEGKDCTTNKNEQRPKTSSKDNKKAPPRTKAKCSSSKQHPLPPPHHSLAQAPADAQNVQPRREHPLVARPSTNSRESDPRVIEPSPRQTPEEQRETLEEGQPENTQQVITANRIPRGHILPLMSSGENSLQF